MLLDVGFRVAGNNAQGASQRQRGPRPAGPKPTGESKPAFESLDEGAFPKLGA